MNGCRGRNGTAQRAGPAQHGRCTDWAPSAGQILTSDVPLWAAFKKGLHELGYAGNEKGRWAGERVLDAYDLGVRSRDPRRGNDNAHRRT